MTAPADLAILVVAAGRGSRAGEGLPKQYRRLAGRTLLAHSLAAMIRGAPEARVLPVIHADDGDLFRQSLLDLGPETAARVAAPVFGGPTRQDSVRAGLEALDATPPALVLIHDAARPFASAALVARAVAAAEGFGAAIPGLAVTDTIKEIDSEGVITGTLARARLRAVQTPQAFRYDLVLAAHRRAAAAGLVSLTDDAAVAEWAGHPVHIFEGDAGNMKVTTVEDFAVAEARLLSALPDVRTGQGFDVHGFGPGDHVCLGGVTIAHDRGLAGHSDADVLAHAITDALLGALAEGDIGSHFPPSDPKWKGAASKIFLAAAAEKVAARGGMIAHVDATLICETPKVGPHRDRIRESLAAILAMPVDRIAVKATTTERLGFTGREEGIAAMAVATVRLPV